MNIPKPIESLKSVNVFRRKAGGCSRGGIILAYRLPLRLEKDIASFMSGLGQPALTFAMGPYFKIEKQAYVITAIKQIREIRFTFKKQAAASILPIFEDLLKKYMEEKLK